MSFPKTKTITLYVVFQSTYNIKYDLALCSYISSENVLEDRGQI